MKRIAAVMAAAAFMLTACASHPDAAACKAAMRAQFKLALRLGPNAPKGAEPAACKGLPASELRRFFGEILGGH